MTKNTKIFYYLLSVLLVLLIAASALAFYKCRKCISADETPQIIGAVKLIPEGDKHLGANIEISAIVKCAWDKRPQEVIYNPPKGLKIAGTPAITLNKLGFGYAEWKIVINAIPYRNGDISASSFEISFNSAKKAKENSKNLSLNIPAFKILPLNVTGGDLAIAAKIAAKKASYFWYAAAAIAVVALFLIYYFFLRKKAAVKVIVTPWGAALMELCELRQKMKNGKISLESCVSSLTDIVRVYLEKRFSLNAPTQTTYEFLQDLDRAGSPLADGHRGFLRDFMTSADLVKFANLPADVKLFDDAAEKAERLVCETKPAENNREIQK